MFSACRRSRRGRIPYHGIQSNFCLHTSRRAIRTSAWSKTRKTSKFFAYTALGATAVYLVDSKFYASSLTRSIRTLYTGAIIALDYKLFFNAANADAIPQLHERVAERLFNCIYDNGGLYIKLGQAIAANTALLPPAFQSRFASLFDDAPQIPFSDVERVICKEFRVRGVDEIFLEFEHEAVASASIAQVHRARLKDGGGEDGRGTLVAVKVQKPDVTQQVEWDLTAYKFLMWCYDQIFPLPVYFLANFIASRLRLELDFENEAENAKRTASYLESFSSSSLLSTHSALATLGKRVYVPKVYDEYTTKHVMTAEWIDGVRMSDRKGLERLVNGTASANTPISTKDPFAIGSTSVYDTSLAQLETRKELNGKNWDGAGTSQGRTYWRDNNIPIKGGNKAIMQSMIDLFCAQMFVYGFIHCDPHPGNIIIRRLVPSNEPQLVILDHALYVTLSPTFRSQYAHLWKALLTLDWDEIKMVTKEWGIGHGAEDLFASGVLMRPVRRKSPENEEHTAEPKKIDQYELAQKMKEKLAIFLLDQEKWPKELVFIGRNMRIVQGNNQMFGSPVNRIRITAEWASRSLSYLPPPSTNSALKIAQPRSALKHRLIAMYNHLIFLGMLLSMDLAFYSSKIKYFFRNLWAMGRLKTGGFEDDIEESMRDFAKDNFGFEIGEGAFEG